MPTNRRRRLRVSKHVPATITPEYRQHLVLKDFMGDLSEEEIEVAKELKIYRWDGWVKARRLARTQAMGEG